MRYAKIYDQMWQNPDFVALSMQAKLCYTYLCSCCHCNQIGYFRIPLAYMAADMGMTPTDAAKVVKELESAGFVRFDADTSRMLIRSYLKWNPPDSIKNLKAMAKVFDQMEASELDPLFVSIANEMAEQRGMSLFSQVSKRASKIKESPSIANVMPHEMPHVMPQKEGMACKEQEQEQEQEYSSLRSLAPSCAENVAPSAPKPEKTTMDDSQDTLLVLPCTGSRSWTVTRGYLDGVRDAYPGVDLLAECRKAKVWLEANPTRMKTFRGMKAFLANWFTKAQDHQCRQAPYRGTASRSSSLPDSAVHTEEAWAGRKGGKLFTDGGES